MASNRSSCVFQLFLSRVAPQVTGLGQNSVYHFRVRAINLRGVTSEWSFLAQAATALRQGNAGTAGSNYGAGSILCRPHNAAEVGGWVGGWVGLTFFRDLHGSS